MMNQDEILPRELASRVSRRGKWTPEEERYTEKIICKWWSISFFHFIFVLFYFVNDHYFFVVDFENGTLDVPGNVLLKHIVLSRYNFLDCTQT